MNIRCEIDYLHEGLSLLFALGREKSYEEQIDHRLHLENADWKELKKERKAELALLYQLEKEAKRTFKDDWENFLFYFGEIRENDFSDHLGRVLLFFDEYDRKELISFSDYKKQIINLKEDDLRQSFSTILQGLFDSTRDSTQYLFLDTDEALVEYILSQDLSTEHVLKLEDFYFNHDYHANKALAFVEKAISILNTHHSQIEEIIASFKDYWLQKTDGDFMNYFASRYAFLQPFISNKYGHVIIPSICYPCMKGINALLDDDGMPSEAFYFPVGMLYGDAFPMIYAQTESPKEITDKDCIEMLKLISEKTRFEILKEISRKPAFGNELAQKLNLTTATVSHHMNLLMNANLVSMSQEGTRIYYRSNPEVIQKYFSKIRTDLL